MSLSKILILGMGENKMKVKFVGYKQKNREFFTNPKGLLEKGNEYAVNQITCDPTNDDLTSISLLGIVGHFGFTWFKIIKEKKEG